MQNRKKQTDWAGILLMLVRHTIQGPSGVWFALGGFFILEWFIHASAPVVEHLIDPVLPLLGLHPKTELAEALAGAVLPSALLGGVAIALWRYLNHLQSSQDEEAAGRIFAHRGLIVSLSSFNIAPQAHDGVPKQEVKARIEAAVIPSAGSGPNHREHVLRQLYDTNWGPIAGAVELHRQRLSHVWVICTPAVMDDFETIAKCIRLLKGPETRVERVPLLDPNSVGGMRLRVHEIYEEMVKPAGLRDNQVITDMTGGTAAMTAGLILATLDEDRHVEYLPQGLASLLENGQPRQDLASLYRYIHTSPGDVARALVSFLQRKTGEDEDSH